MDQQSLTRSEPAGATALGPIPSLMDRFRVLKDLWRGIAGLVDGSPGVAPDLPPDDAQALRQQMRDCLDGKGGEVSARSRAAALGRTYLSLNREGREKFLRILAEDFAPDSKQVDAALHAVLQAAPEQRALAEAALRAALEAPRLRLLTQFNGLPEGVKFLVDLRAELLPLAAKDPQLKALEADLKSLLAAWFDIGFLELHRITWRSPAVVLEKIMAYEAVHAIESWNDLKNRLDSDRRLFGFFHPRMPDEPLIFVEVALVKGIAGNIHELLDEAAPVGDPLAADTAIFYSISNAQKGLAGISFGNFLIKRVVDRLKGEFQNLKTFATLSPVPGFRDWLDERLAEGQAALLLPAEQKGLKAAGLKGGLREMLAEPGWQADPVIADAFKGPLTRLCARYLAEAKARSGRARDPVAHFHLSNGARLERINWLADLSPKGLNQSYGLMVNYLYKLGEIDDNHEAYTGQGKVTVSSAVKSLVKA